MVINDNKLTSFLIWLSNIQTHTLTHTPHTHCLVKPNQFSILAVNPTVNEADVLVFSWFSDSTCLQEVNSVTEEGGVKERGFSSKTEARRAE